MNGSKLRILHTLHGLYAQHSLDVAGPDARAARLAWASKLLRRQVRSFTDLTESEADALIDVLKALTGQTVPAAERWQRPRDRHLAEAFGTHGRRRRRGRDEVLASPSDLSAIEEMWQRLGWTREQFEAWLCGPTSPLKPHATAALRTWTQVNRVRWALKALLKRAGLWRPGRAA